MTAGPHLHGCLAGVWRQLLCDDLCPQYMSEVLKGFFPNVLIIEDFPPFNIAEN